MASGYWGGLVQGFQERRDLEAQRNLQQARLDQEQANRVFSYLLASRDPVMQGMALEGLMRPPTKKGGFQGFMGGYEGNPFVGQIVSRMNEMVPEDQPAPPTSPAPAAGQTAQMSTNVPVEPGSEIPSMQFGPEAAGANMAANAMEGGPPPSFEQSVQVSGAMPGPPPQPPVSKWKRRGTGVPTAEEIAEETARRQQQARIETARQQLMQAGATPEEIQHAIMGMLGAPVNQRTLSAVTQWGVKLPGQEAVVPVLLDQNKGYVTAGGQPLPPGAQMVRMTGGSGTGGSLTSTVQDSPAARAELIAMGADPTVVNRGTSTGYWRMRQGGDGSVMVQPAEYTPPPALSGTREVLEEGVPVIVGVDRNTGQPTGRIGDAPRFTPSQSEEDAKALIAAVDAEIKLQQSSLLGRQRGVSPQQRDQITAGKAKEMNLPYQTYDQATRAARTQAPQPQRTRSTGGSVAERVRQRALQNRAGGGAGGGQATPPPRPQLPPARTGGPGPRK